MMRDGVLVAEVRVCGPLAGYAVGFAECLATQGYTAGSVRCQMYLLAQLSRWLEAERLDTRGLTELAAERFIAARRVRVDRLFRSRWALEPAISYLRGLGIAPEPAQPALGPADELIERYRRYLLVERTLTVDTARVYLTAITPFVATLASPDGLEFGRVTAAAVSSFILAEADRRAGTSIQLGRAAARRLRRGYVPAPA